MVRKFETPFLWLSQLIRGRPKPWNYFKISGLMINAYEILRRKKIEKTVKEVGIHRFLNFDGPIIMDSGGFLFMKENRISIHPDEILDLYERSKPDFGVVLDYPLNPGLGPKEVKKRQNITLRNTRYMICRYSKKNPELIPVIHGHTIESACWHLNELKKIYDFNIYGIGSVVPSVFTSRGAGGIYNVIEIVTFIRSQLPDDKIIHVFGVGSTLTMHLMFFSGANSVDSTGWRTKAAFGAIQLPGVGDRYITLNKKHKEYPNLSREEMKVLEDCKCPICRKFSLKELMESFEYRAIHNSWVFQKELEIARKLIREGENEYEEYVKGIMKTTKFCNVFKFAKEIKAKYSTLNH